MKRDSFKIFNIIFSLAIVAILVMLYWSSVLVEEDLKALKNETALLRRDVTERLIAPAPEALSTPNSTSVNRSQIDPSLPNLLEEDPFYTTTLPKMLGSNFKPHGIRHDAVLGRPENLHPFAGWINPATWTRQCSVSVARLQFGKFETFAPDMAIKVEERKNATTGAVEFWVHLRDGVYWQPLRPSFFSDGFQLSLHFQKKHQVTAEDFKFYLDAIMNPYVQESGALASRTLYNEIDELVVVDPLTFIVRWRGKLVEDKDGKTVPRIKYIAKSLTGGLAPLASFVYKYFSDGTKIVEEDADPNTYRTNSVWAQNFSQHWAKQVIVSCGPWTFDGMSEEGIKFKRNPNHYFPYDVLVNGLEITFKNTFEAAFNDFKTGRLDTYYAQPEQLTEFQKLIDEKKGNGDNGISKIPYLYRAYNYIGWNEVRPYFRSKAVRQALTLAIDRKRIIRQNLNGMGIEITGTFYPYSKENDASLMPWPYDPQRAKHLLEEEGWYDQNGDGIIEKEIEGQMVPFKFSLTYFVRNTTSKAICEYVATALREIGIQCDLSGVDNADLSAAFEGKSFDAIFLGWSLGTPPTDPRQLWHSSGAKEPGSSNGIGFANAEVDKIIDQLDYEDNPTKRIALYHEFGRIIYDEAPYVFLYAPYRNLAYYNYVQNVFLPTERPDLVPGADIAEPSFDVMWLKK